MCFTLSASSLLYIDECLTEILRKKVVFSGITDKDVHQIERGGEAMVNTLETWTDRNLKVQQRQIQSVAPQTEKPQATGQAGG